MTSAPDPPGEKCIWTNNLISAEPETGRRGPHTSGFRIKMGWARIAIGRENAGFPSPDTGRAPRPTSDPHYQTRYPKNPYSSRTPRSRMAYQAPVADQDSHRLAGMLEFAESLRVELGNMTSRVNDTGAPLEEQRLTGFRGEVRPAMGQISGMRRCPNNLITQSSPFRLGCRGTNNIISADARPSRHPNRTAAAD